MYSLKCEVDGSSENKLEGMSGAVVSMIECRNWQSQASLHVQEKEQCVHWGLSVQSVWEWLTEHTEFLKVISQAGEAWEEDMGRTDQIRAVQGSQKHEWKQTCGTNTGKFLRNFPDAPRGDA